MDNSRETFEKYFELKNIQKEIINQLRQVKQPYRNILYKFYIQGKTLVTVASEMKYNYEYVKNMNGQALIEFEKCTTKSY